MTRTALAATALSLLFAGSAWAECAWLLWIEHVHTKPLDKPPYIEEKRWWERENAFKTFEQCLEIKQRIWTVIASRYDDLTKYPGIEKVERAPYEGVFITLKGGNGHHNQIVRCYPDTVDPRK